MLMGYVGHHQGTDCLDKGPPVCGSGPVMFPPLVVAISIFVKWETKTPLAIRSH